MITKHQVICPLCGVHYSSIDNPACGSCPIHQGCTMTCCPACGHTTIDTSRSKLVQLTTRILDRKQAIHPMKINHKKRWSSMLNFDWFQKLRTRSNPKSHASKTTNPRFRQNSQTLAEVRPGSQARIVAFSDHLPPNRRAHLVAYGLTPGYWVDVLQQSPVTIIQVDHTEIALENELAQGVFVTA